MTYIHCNNRVYEQINQAVLYEARMLLAEPLYQELVSHYICFSATTLATSYVNMCSERPTRE